MRARTVLRSLFRSALLALALTLLAPGPAHLPAQARTGEHDTQVYDEAWRIVRDKFYDRNLKGLDWDTVGDRHRADYASAKTDAERSAAINAMLAELGASHTHHYTRDETAYYELADIFSYKLRREIPRYFSGDKIAYAGIGMFTKAIDGKTFISAVFPGLPADKAGLKLGDEIVSANGAPFEPVASFRNKVGSTVALKVRRVENGPLIDIAVEPKQIEPGETFAAALKDSARVIHSNGRRIGYVRIWSYADSDYQKALEDVLSDGKLKDADALVWDLRGGWGGAQPYYLNVFNPYGPTMTLTARDGEAHLVNYRWRKPVALLIDNGTRSGKEVLAYGFKKNGYGPVVGERSAGALLAATAFLLSDGSLLILAVEDVSVEGERLEGKGVEPTIAVPFDIRYAAGKDPQLDKAVEVLAGGA
ncbi:MAG TPA: S41 family peptidase [Hyphomicrobium sp.]|nr:S41 family peptidase [Hyphomicrobium sp.]